MYGLPGQAASTGGPSRVPGSLRYAAGMNAKGAVVVVLGLVGALYAYSAWRNVEAARAAETACESLKADLSVLLTPARARALFDTDASLVRDAVFAATTAACEDVREALEPWRFNLFVRRRFREDPGRRLGLEQAKWMAESRCATALGGPVDPATPPARKAAVDQACVVLGELLTALAHPNAPLLDPSEALAAEEAQRAQAMVRSVVPGAPEPQAGAGPTPAVEPAAGAPAPARPRPGVTLAPERAIGAWEMDDRLVTLAAMARTLRARAGLAGPAPKAPPEGKRPAR
ncbi:MAG: hypothetical protein D6729_09250 [Deltaproteobacteria bacterium]|nr:MAG: hypothetical protein D6729_09250 [Deltaproteobacteria bacterium]